MASTARGAPPDASIRFRAPTYVRNVIERRRLLATLRAGAGRQLVVIHAPAGYGKTTLAVQWLQELQHDGADVAWLGLHRDDNDPHWFLSHLLEALRRALPAEDALDELKALIEQGGLAGELLAPAPVLVELLVEVVLVDAGLAVEARPGVAVPPPGAAHVPGRVERPHPKALLAQLVQLVQPRHPGPEDHRVQLERRAGVAPVRVDRHRSTSSR
jgi:hypothetical protein